MAALELFLFGKPQVKYKGHPVSDFTTAKTEALLYYLVMTRRPQPRARLADLFWSDVPESQGRRSLTKALSVLRKHFDAYLRVDHHEVAFIDHIPYSLDVAQFEARIAAGEHQGDFDGLQAAVALYRGDFLEGFFVRDAIAFEDWLFNERERLRELMLDGLDLLVESYLHQSATDLTAGIEYAARLLSLDPWRETAHRQLMILLARNGQRSAALAQYETCRQVIDEEFGVEPSPETTELYERLKESEAPPPHNLPLQFTPFVGREAELRRIGSQLDDPQCRLLTLIGPGGIGKTRLALQAAFRYTRPELTLGGTTFADGVYFVNLVPISEPQGQRLGPSTSSADQIALTIADTLQLNFHGPGDFRTQLVQYLGQKAMLVVLDNFEYLVDGVDLLADLLRRTTKLKLLVTTRERLTLREERLLELSGLTFPPAPTSPAQQLLFQTIGGSTARSQADTTDQPSGEADAPDNAWLDDYSAVTFFIQQAQRLRTGLTFSPADRLAIVRICQLVEGVPLALELAAGWLRVLTCAEVVTEIEQNLDFLTASARNIPAHHRSLRVVFERSWAMLTQVERGVFAKMSVFRGGFRREAAEAVLGASLPILSSLVDKSLLRRTAEGRYEVHELLRQYATEKLWVEKFDDDASPAADLASIEAALLFNPAHAVWQVYSRYYLDFVSGREGLLRGDSPQEAVTAIRLELDNIRQAWYWAATHSGPADLRHCLNGMSRFYDITGLFQEGELIFQQAAESVADRLTTPDLIEAEAKAVLCRLLAEQTRFMLRRGVVDEAHPVVAGAVELAEELAEPILLALAYRQQGEAYIFGGNSEPALNRLEMALDRIEAVIETAESITMPEARLIEAETLRDTGIANQLQSNYDAARRWYEAALSAFRRLKDRRYEGIILMNLGTMAFDQADYDQLKPYYDQALFIFREIGDRYGEGIIVGNRGFLAYELGDFNDALAFCHEALQLHRQTHDQVAESNSLHTLGNIMRDLGNYQVAQSYYEQCLQVRQRTGDQLLECYVLTDLGLLWYEQGNPEQARSNSQQALERAESIGAQTAMALALTHLGHAQAALDETAAAEAAYRQALTVRQAIGEHQRALAASTGLAWLALQAGRLAEAQQQAAEVLDQLAQPLNPGPAERFRCYWRCYQILKAADDERARPLLGEIHELLQAQAREISNPEQRRTYLEDVPVHRALITAYRAQRGRSG